MLKTCFPFPVSNQDGSTKPKEHLGRTVSSDFAVCVTWLEPSGACGGTSMQAKEEVACKSYIGGASDKSNGRHRWDGALHWSEEDVAVLQVLIGGGKGPAKINRRHPE
eukprot:523945-Amphidinium_carterae.1